MRLPVTDFTKELEKYQQHLKKELDIKIITQKLKIVL